MTYHLLASHVTESTTYYIRIPRRAWHHPQRKFFLQMKVVLRISKLGSCLLSEGSFLPVRRRTLWCVFMYFWLAQQRRQEWYCTRFKLQLTHPQEILEDAADTRAGLVPAALLQYHTQNRQQISTKHNVLFFGVRRHAHSAPLPTPTSSSSRLQVGPHRLGSGWN